MNRDYQEYNEEDAMCAILDTLETLGWTFRCRICQRKTSYFCSHCTGTNGQSSWICNATTRRSCFEQHL